MKRRMMFVWYLLICLVIVFSGCNDDVTPYGMNKMKRPIIIIAINEKGVILLDGDNNIYTYNKGYYFSQILINSDFKVGDILAIGE